MSVAEVATAPAETVEAPFTDGAGDANIVAEPPSRPETAAVTMRAFIECVICVVPPYVQVGFDGLWKRRRHRNPVCAGKSTYSIAFWNSGLAKIFSGFKDQELRRVACSAADN
jgi:hypothetical protein